jgi:hypothetical protein
MRSSRLPAFLFILSLSMGACGGPPARAPSGHAGTLPRTFAEAFRVDANGDPHAAVKAHLDVVRTAAQAGGDPWQVAALEASLDALVTRAMPSLGDAAGDAALANRTREASAIAQDLARSANAAMGPFAKGLIARALTAMAQRRGDAAEAERQRAASGCVMQAAVMGPTAWTPVTGVDEPGPLDSPDARLPETYSRGDAFGHTLKPIPVLGHGCALPLSAWTARPGVREVAMDVSVGRAQAIGLALRAHGAAALRAGGTPILRRAFDLGDGEAARFARVWVTPGTLRIVARVGTAKEDDTVEIDAFGEDGGPLPVSLPRTGTAASGRVVRIESAQPSACKGTEEALLIASAAIASGDPREAERLLWPSAAKADAPPELALAYARAAETARDLSTATRAERARSAYERVLDVWPASWEAMTAHAVLAGVRRGRDEAGVEALRDLDALRVKARGQGASPALDAFEALTSGRERLFDHARAALEKARAPLAGTALFADAETAATPRVGAELIAALCDPQRATAQDTLSCFDALRASGDHASAMRELGRARAVLGAPRRFAPLELREALAHSDPKALTEASQLLLPGEETLWHLALMRNQAPAESGRNAEDLAKYLGLFVDTARDAPAAIAPLMRAAGDDPTRDFEGVAERLAAQDPAHDVLANAATAVLAHTERYAVSPDGLLRWVVFDVRRVSGTTDVEENAEAGVPEVWGRSTMHALRRRILKRDGRILEPDHAPHAAQGHADLSQLEQGDVVEAIYEGWALPGDTGDVGIDTPDLLPERTAVRDATIELRLPRGLRGSLWSHALLGKAAERADGEARVLTWHVADRPVRRVEDAVPRMDRNVSVSFSTARWADVARAMRETVAALDERDPEIRAWAQEAAGATGGAAPTRSTVDAIVVAAGKALREADPGTLSDYGGGVAPVQSQTARTFLASHDGSRSWLVLRSLRELGVPCDLVIAENDPYSADPSFPPHFGRFVHPLVVAKVEGSEVWIDADVAGPPLPAGRVSPELRGRLALHTDGTIAPLPAVGSPDGERDEVDVRLVLDEHGDARGTFAVVLRGRDAQELAEALFRIVGAERQRALRDVVLAWLPWANVDDVSLASTEGSWQVSLRADVSVSGYAQLEGAKTWLLPGLDTLHWTSPHARVSSLAATFATRAGRESALALSTALQYHVHRRVELPKGATVARLPGPLDLKANLVEASRKMNVMPDAVEDDFALGVATGTIPPSDYDAFVKAAHAVDDGFLASARVTMP